jgi:hypothetical protein
MPTSAFRVLLVLPMLLVSCAEGRREGTNQSDAGPAAVNLLREVDGAPGSGTRRAGEGRWRNSAVYVDGVPVSALTFGELPIGLKPVWRAEEVNVEIEPGKPAPAPRVIETRCYRFSELLTALRVNLKKVRELHVYGPKLTDSIVVSGAELRRRGRDFLFRFGGEVEGKPIPIVPPRFGNGRTPDKINAVLVYIEREPPKLDPEEGFKLEGRVIVDIPYRGEPMRGGVRIYLDDRLATVFKRRTMEMSASRRLVDALASHGIDPVSIAEVWAIHRERRVARFTPEDLQSLTFQMEEGAQGELLLGKQPASAIALHTKPVDPSQLPQIRPGEEF